MDNIGNGKFLNYNNDSLLVGNQRNNIQHIQQPIYHLSQQQISSDHINNNNNNNNSISNLNYNDFSPITIIPTRTRIKGTKIKNISTTKMNNEEIIIGRHTLIIKTTATATASTITGTVTTATATGTGAATISASASTTATTAAASVTVGGGTSTNHHQKSKFGNSEFHEKSPHYSQIIAALAVSFGPLAAGLGKGYTSPAIASLQELQMRYKSNLTSFSVSDQQASWIASLSLLGALFGGIFGGMAMQYGRRKVLTFISLPFSLAWILTVFAKAIETMFVTAFIAGFCCSIVTMVTQVYISEISSPEIRGFLSAIQKISGHLGVLISFSLGAYLDWRQLAMMVSIAPILLFLTIIYVPETPSYLILVGRNEDAFRSLVWLRGPYSNVEAEFETIKRNIQLSKQLLNKVFEKQQQQQQQQQHQQQYLLSNCSSVMTSLVQILIELKENFKNIRFIKPLMITCGLTVIQRFTGANSFGFYAVKIFRQTFAGMNPHGGAIAVGFVQLLSSMLSGLLIDTIGRIPLLITSSVFMSLALASFGSCVYYEQATRLINLNANGFDIDAAVTQGNTDWLPLLCVLVFIIAFSLGISPISSLLIGELFPLGCRGLGSSVATTFSYFCAFLSVKTFVDLQELLGLYGLFWLYACISCLGLLFIVMIVPETKGKDLEEMNPIFSQMCKTYR